MAIKCPHCGAFNSNEATECRKCGKPMVENQQAAASAEAEKSERGRERFWRRLFPKRNKSN